VVLRLALALCVRLGVAQGLALTLAQPLGV
jgi:hypothetical protein